MTSHIRRSKMAMKAIIGLVTSIWPVSGRLVTVISLVILPIIVMGSDFLYSVVFKELLLKDVNYVTGIPELAFLEYSIRFVQISIFIMIIFLFPPYPAPIPIDLYFKQRGPERAVDEYQSVKKILYVAVPLFIVLTVLPYVDPVIQRYSTITLTQAYRENSFFVAQTVSLFVVLAGLLKLIFTVFRKQFRLYYAKGCFAKAKAVRNKETEKLSYFVKGLEAYNSYLRRNLNVQIGDMKKFVASILSSPYHKKIKDVNRICDIFSRTSAETHALEPLLPLRHYLATGQPISMDQLLTQQPIIGKIKDMSTFFAVTAVPLAISLVDLYQKVVH
jgi:hypothetical protein